MVKKFVYLLSFIELFSFGLVIPMLGIQIIAVGGNRFILGILGSAQCLLQFLAGPIFGSWSDSAGAKPALLVSAYGLLVAQLIFSIPNLYCYMLGRIINACFLHGQILVKTLLSEAKEVDQAGIQGKLRAVGAMSFTFAPIIGGIIMGRPNGFFYLSILCTLLSIINVIVCHLLPAVDVSKKSTKENTQKGNQIINNLKQVDWKIFGTLFTLRFLIETAASIYHQNLGYVFAEVFHSTPNEVGLIISFYGVCAIIINMNMKSLRKYITDGYKWGTIGMLGAFAIIYMFPYFWMYILFIVLFSLFKTLIEATWTDSIIDMTTETNSGAVNGAFQSLVQLAGFIAPLINGYVGQTFGHSSTIIMCCFIAFSAFGVTYSVKSDIKKFKKD